MFKLLPLFFAFFTLSVAQFWHPLVVRPYHGTHFFQFNSHIFNYGLRATNLRMCTYSEISYKKCLHTVTAARNNSIPLALGCVRQESEKGCISSVENDKADFVVLNDHGYKGARASGLRPLVFAKESDESLYIAVAPRNITFVGVQEAPL